MASFNVSVHHKTTREIAVVRLQGFSEKVRDQFEGHVSEVEESWDDNGNVAFSFSAMGMSIKGDVSTDEEQVTVKGTLPFAALPFKGLIEQTISEKIQEAVESDE